MITSDDDGPGREPDDPLATLLWPEPLHLSPPPGRYEAIRRTAGRRRLARATATAGAASAVVAAIALLVAIPLRGDAPGDPHPSSPVVPVAPPSGETPTETGSPEPSPSPSKSDRPGSDDPATSQPTDDLRREQEEESRDREDPDTRGSQGGGARPSERATRDRDDLPRTPTADADRRTISPRS